MMENKNKKSLTDGEALRREWHTCSFCGKVFEDAIERLLHEYTDHAEEIEREKQERQKKKEDS